MSRLVPSLTNNKHSHPDLRFVNFNQDNSCISTGTRKGYSITNCEPFGRVYLKTEPAEVIIVEMLFCTSLVALVLVGGNTPGATNSARKLQIVNTKRQSKICDLSFPTTVLAVKLNRKRLVAVLEEQIYIYDISNMKLLHTIETSPNPSAICALSPSSTSSLLAYPSLHTGPTSPLSSNPPSQPPAPSDGLVHIFDTTPCSSLNLIPAHKAPIAALSLNSTGTLLATASTKGTVIRVFSLPAGDCVASFRRGRTSLRIWSIAFNAVSSLMCVSSESETVHIFKLPAPGQGNGMGRPGAGRRGASEYGGDDDFPAGGGATGQYTQTLGRYSGGQAAAGAGANGYEAFIDSKKNAGGLTGSLSGTLRRGSSKLTKMAGGYLPASLTEMWDPERDFAYLKLPTPGVQSVVSMSSTTPQVMVVTSEGIMYSYNIDLENGGECVLQKSYSLTEGFDDAPEGHINGRNGSGSNGSTATE